MPAKKKAVKKTAKKKAAKKTAEKKEKKPERKSWSEGHPADGFGNTRRAMP